MLQSSPVRFRPVRHIIMELEGTVIDSQTTTNDMIAEYLKKFNKILSPEMKTKILGRFPEDLYDILKSEYKIGHTFQEYKKHMKILKEKHFHNIRFMPGAQTLISWFYDHDIPMGLVSSCSKEELLKKTANCGDIMKKFKHITTINEVDREKPYPDIFLTSASKFIHPANPQDVLVFESSLDGVEAARSAGMQVILIGTCFNETEKRRPTKTIKNLCDFDSKEFGLP